jgi:hypothetical protein
MKVTWCELLKFHRVIYLQSVLYTDLLYISFMGIWKYYDIWMKIFIYTSSGKESK